MSIQKKLLPVVCAAVFVSLARAHEFEFSFPLEGSQEVQTPPVMTQATGMADVLLDTDTNLLSWDIQFQGITSGVVLAHFHGPAPAGMNAGIRVDIGAVSGLASPMIGQATITDLQEQDILDGFWYVNIHSNQFPMGELRGQVVPEPAVLVLLGVGVGACVVSKVRRHRRR